MEQSKGSFFAYIAKEPGRTGKNQAVYQVVKSADHMKAWHAVDALESECYSFKTNSVIKSEPVKSC